jgi:hypothetical protein
MPIEWPTVIEGGVPILGGLYATALGYGFIRISTSLPSARQQKFLARFKWLGPALVLFGILTAWQTHRRAVHPPAEEIARVEYCPFEAGCDAHLCLNEGFSLRNSTEVAVHELCTNPTFSIHSSYL